MRRGVGIGRFETANKQNELFQQQGNQIVDTMKQQLEQFKVKLQSFAEKHRHQIAKDPQFRKHFNELCAKVGVDPLASNKSFWADLLGVGNFYFKLAIQIIEVCMTTRHINGGLMDVNDLLERLQKKRNEVSSAQPTASSPHHRDIAAYDIERAVRSMGALGHGYKLVKLGNKTFLQTVPMELSQDNTVVIQLAGDKSYTTKSEIMKELGWDATRADVALNNLLCDGLAWIDVAPREEDKYWFPSVFFGSQRL